MLRQMPFELSTRPVSVPVSIPLLYERMVGNHFNIFFTGIIVYSLKSIGTSHVSNDQMKIKYKLLQVGQSNSSIIRA